MNAPREPNVRIRTVDPFDQPRILGRQNSGPSSYRTILAPSAKSARQDVACNTGLPQPPRLSSSE